MGVEIIQADAGDAWPIESGSVACVAFSPPYGAGVRYDADPDGDQMPWPDYEKLARHVMNETARVLIPGGKWWANVMPSVPYEVGSSRRVNLLSIWTMAAQWAGLAYRDTITWTTEGRGGTTAWGAWERPTAPNLRGEWEAILVGSSGPWEREAPADYEGFRDREGNWARLCSNAWRIQPESDRGHPAPFPVELPRRCIRLSTFPGELVVDPFAGTGSTCLAAKQLGRRAIGLERSQVYVDRANARLAQGSLF